MDNAERSRRTREAVIAAAQAILSRDGPKRLTLDAIVKESGISKGGLMHQFHSKEAVLKALLEHQVASSRQRFDQQLELLDAGTDHRHLVAQLATMKQALGTSSGMISAVMAALSEDPALLDVSTESQGEHVRAIADESDNPDLSLLRWSAARGLIITRMIGMCPFSDQERDRLFDRLMDNAFWGATERNTKRHK